MRVTPISAGEYVIVLFSESTSTEPEPNKVTSSDTVYVDVSKSLESSSDKSITNGISTLVVSDKFGSVLLSAVSETDTLASDEACPEYTSCSTGSTLYSN